MDETRVEKISLMRSDAQMHIRQNVHRLDTVSKLTTQPPKYLQSAKRKLFESVRTNPTGSTLNNSLTAASIEGAAALRRVVDGKVTLHQIMTNILSNMKYK